MKQINSNVPIVLSPTNKRGLLIRIFNVLEGSGSGNGSTCCPKRETAMENSHSNDYLDLDGSDDNGTNVKDMVF